MKKKARELEKMSTPELDSKLLEFKKELMKLNAQRATGTIPKNPGLIKQTRKAIARTIMLMENQDMNIKKNKEVKEKQ